MVAIEDIYRNFDRKTIKYSIRKAEKSGVEIIERNSNEGINEFYRLNKMTRKKHGMPAQPKKFFTNLYKN
nr:peptidoglycan bridge formation glycyltransferase FemA/FemB family protein [Candidatus Aenigmarchaeota archaeon]